MGPKDYASIPSGPSSRALNKLIQHIRYTYRQTQKTTHDEMNHVGLGVTKPNPENCKNCSSKCAYRCAQLSYITQHGVVLIIFPLNLQTSITAQILSTGGDGVVVPTCTAIAAYSDQTFLLTISWSVCMGLCVCPVDCGKTADRIRMPFGMVGRTGPWMSQVWGSVNGKG